MRFLGIDLAWKDGNPSGLALLGGRSFPLHLRERPRTAARHADVLDWIARNAAHHRASVGIDAPLLGLGLGRRGCDDLISSRFGRFHASTHSPPSYPGLAAFTRALLEAHEIEALGPGWNPRSRCPAIREVYPNALQAFLFGLDRNPGLTIATYKLRRFGSRRGWVERGLRPFIERCIAWRALVADQPDVSMSVAELKSIEDRWDAMICAIATALEFFEKGSMRFYPGDGAAWRRGYILAPALPTRPRS